MNVLKNCIKLKYAFHNLTHSVRNLKKKPKWRPGQRLKNEENTVTYSYWLILKMT